MAVMSWLRARVLVLSCVALACLAWTPASPHERAVELLASLSVPEVPNDRRQAASDVAVENFTAAGLGTARIYKPPRVRRSLVLAHGVHHEGIDEPRFRRFARELAKLGIVVLTPALPSLSEYRVSADSVERISNAVRVLAARPELTAGRKVGLIGISFGGGLSLVAASQDDVGRHLEYVTSIGGHHDLYRVLRFLLTNRVETTNGEVALTAHEYGSALLVHRHLPRLAPAVDRATLEEAFRLWIAENRNAARAKATQLTTQRGRDLFTRLEQGRLDSFISELEPLLKASQDELSALSPRGKLSKIPAPVYLLHGGIDRVIPAAELSWAALELAAAGKPHRALVTSLIEHVTPDRPAGVFEKLALVDFMASML